MNREQGRAGAASGGGKGPRGSEPCAGLAAGRLAPDPSPRQRSGAGGAPRARGLLRDPSSEDAPAGPAARAPLRSLGPFNALNFVFLQNLLLNIKHR